MKQLNDIEMRTIQFLVTENCNLDCIYCYEKNKNTQTISSDFVKEKIREQMIEDNGYKELSIDFFGGEPLMEFDLIKEIVEWFHQVNWPEGSKDFRFAITTNGTLLDEAKKTWFLKFKDSVTLCLSLDGTKESHNRNRCNSYNDVVKHIKFFQENWPKQPVKMTISHHTINQIFDGIVHIHNLGLPVEANIVFENVWGNEEEKQQALKTYAEELEKLILFYINNKELPRPRLINKNLMSLYDRRHPGDNMFCGAGKHLICWTANTEQYPCMRFAPISTSNPLKNKNNAQRTINKNCNKCAFERLCPTCEGHNYEVTGSCFNRTTFHCDFFKIEMLASAKLFYLENRNEILGEKITDKNEEHNLSCLRKILAIMTVNDLCGDNTTI